MTPETLTQQLDRQAFVKITRLTSNDGVMRCYIIYIIAKLLAVKKIQNFNLHPRIDTGFIKLLENVKS